MRQSVEQRVRTSDTHVLHGDIGWAPCETWDRKIFDRAGIGKPEPDVVRDYAPVWALRLFRAFHPRARTAEERFVSSATVTILRRANENETFRREVLALARLGASEGTIMDWYGMSTA
jgi:hypothetical protein